jgi:hypothetical protein
MITSEEMLKTLNDLGYDAKSFLVIMAGMKKQSELVILKSQLAAINTTISEQVAAIEVTRQELTGQIAAKQAEIDALSADRAIGV